MPIPKTLVLNIRNNVGMVGWIKDCRLHNKTTWSPVQPLRNDLPISARASAQGEVTFERPTKEEPVLLSELAVLFERVPGTTMSGVVIVQFGVQLVNENIGEPLVGAIESNPWLVPRVDSFTDGETSIGFVTIDLFNVFPALTPAM